MATTESPDGEANRVVAALCRLDPGGAYWRYSAYVSCIVVLAVAGGYLSALLLTGSKANHLGGVYAGILTCLSLLFLKPTSAHRPFREIAAAVAAILVGAGIGGSVGHLPEIAQPATVVVAFAGFYVRRWREPLPMAGFVMVLSFIISQILAPFTPPGVIHASMLSLFVFVSVGFWFLPRRVFTRALVTSVRNMRAAFPHELNMRRYDRDSVMSSTKRVDARLREVNGIRAQADQYNPANAKRHLALVHCAATVARVWENAADSMHYLALDDLGSRSKVLSVCRQAEAAVAAAIETPTQASRQSADAALHRIEDVVDSIVAAREEGERLSDETGVPLFHLINSELALTHLLDAVANLDAELAAQAGAEP